MAERPSTSKEIVSKYSASGTSTGASNCDGQKNNNSSKKEACASSSSFFHKPRKQFCGEYRRSGAAQFFEEEVEQLTSVRKKENAKKPMTIDCRRSTAAQFFVEEETVQHAATVERVVTLLNEAVVTKENTLKNLRIVQELIIYKEPKLMDNFLDEVVSFQHDIKVDVRKFVVTFIDLACKKDPNTLPKIVGNLILILNDSAAAVQKQVLQTTTQLYKVALRWLCSAKSVDDVMEATWTSMTGLKYNIFNMLDCENDGLRTQAIKFMEAVILFQTYKDDYTIVKEGDISLDDIPMIMNIFRPRKMEEEAKEVFDKLIAFHGASHISSYNLMTCMMALSTIAKKRFEFFPKVLQAFESLHVNLPPTLGQSQVSSVRKRLKFELFSLSKHPASEEFYPQISTMLSDLGATPHQISKYFPKIDSLRKRQRHENKPMSKKARYENEQPNDAKHSHKSKVPRLTKAKDSVIDTTAEDLYTKLVGVNVCDLALVSLLNLPDTMPVHFQSTYTPIAAAGTDSQIRHLARLLATQLTIAGLGKGVEEIKAAATEEMVEESEEEEDPGTSKQIKIVVGGTTEKKTKKTLVTLMPTGSKFSRFPKRLNLLEVTTPFSDEQTDNLSTMAYKRILNAENSAANGGASAVRTKILVNLATQFGGNYSNLLKEYIAENPRNRMDLVFAWLFEEYVAYQGFNGSVPTSAAKYEEIVSSLLHIILQNEEHKHVLFPRFFIESPHITLSMLIALKAYCVDESTTKQALQIAKRMTVLRPPKKLDFLGVISELTLNEKLEIRGQAVNCSVELYSNETLKPFIEAFALRSLRFLLKPMPPPECVEATVQTVMWSEELVKICLHLYLSLLPVNHHLIHDLGKVYVETTADMKRIILRSLEIPVKGMSMHSAELLLFVENFPKGAETLVTRLIHILTDKVPPSSELVSRVRDLYHKRVSDVRFLIPIINGLTKQEIIEALPELIKLNPTVVKEVFNRLLATNVSSPLNPAELLIALHNIDSSKCNLKIIIKATSLCFEEKTAYTQVVLAVVIQKLMEQTPLPILLMRTVIQSLASYPHLLGFVTNILKRLIDKQVWKQKKIWEGFIKCCQRTKPQSFQVLLQLPPEQLVEVLQTCPDLQYPLCQHVSNFTDHQKAHVPQHIMIVLDAFKPPVLEKTLDLCGLNKDEDDN